MTESRRLLQHALAAVAYRTQKALRGAPPGFADFRAGVHVRTPHELVWHMTGVIGYARTLLRGGEFTPPRLDAFADEVARFHATLAALRDDLGDDPGDDLGDDPGDASLAASLAASPAAPAASDAQLLQGPVADALTHAGQLALLRRLAGAPVPSENFVHARIDAANVGAEQPAPAAPDAWWRPDQPPLPPGPDPTNARGG